MYNIFVIIFVISITNKAGGNSNNTAPIIMATLVFNQKIQAIGEPIKIGETLKVDSEKLIGNSTKSLYVRKGFLNGTLFLSQRGNGANGAGDICKINEDVEINVNSNLFERLRVLAEKSNAIL